MAIEEPGIGQLVGQLATDAREMARAEVGLVKARAAASVTRYKAAAICFAAAGALGFAGLIALLVGLILTLAPRIGPGLATVVVIGTVLAIAGVLAFMGKARLKVKK